jgi:DNA repair photolyase
MIPELDKGYYHSPRWSNEVADCSMPMTFDQYSLCTWGCLYCFAAFQKECGASRREAYLANRPKAVNVKSFKKHFLDPDSSQFGEYIKSKKVMQWGGMADPFCTLEKKHGVGLEILRFLRELDYPLTFSTKGTWWVRDERYAELFRNNPKWTVKVTLITQDTWKAKIVEPGTPPPRARLKLIEDITNLNCGGAILRLRPFMIGITSPGHLDLIREAHERGAMSMSTEFFCLEQRSKGLKEKLKVMSRASGFNYLSFYKKYSYAHGYLRLNRKVKKPFIDEMDDLCKEIGMRFYVSDAHFKERSCDSNCCGLGQDHNASKGQFTEALLKCKRTGKVTWDDITANGEMDHLKGFLWRRASGFNTRGTDARAKFLDHTMYDYMNWLWNNPNAGQSPYKMFEGIMEPDGTDHNGNIIYVYNGDKA